MNIRLVGQPVILQKDFRGLIPQRSSTNFVREFVARLSRVYTGTDRGLNRCVQMSAPLSSTAAYTTIAVLPPARIMSLDPAQDMFEMKPPSCMVFSTR